MIPDLPNLSNPTLAADFVRPYNRNKVPLVDYARGGVALLDASKGLDVKNWQCELQNGEVYISAAGVPSFLVETILGEPQWISFAFDQNMHYNLTYILADSGAFLYWYDIERGGYVTDSLGRIRTPILRMDDTRRDAFSECELVLSYIKGNALCVRVQRDRFKTEYTLATNSGTTISQCGMNRNFRFQWNTI